VDSDRSAEGVDGRQTRCNVHKRDLTSLVFAVQQAERGE
jgi:hypothetical protein